MKAALPMNRFHTRLASLSDLAEICAIEDTAFTEPYPRSLLEQLVRECSQSFFVATNDAEQILGYCVCTISGRSAHLISIAVDSNLRRKGLGTTLLRRAIESLTAIGVHELWLEVKTDNLEAIGLYRNFGFKTEGLLKAYYSDGSDALRMNLILRPPNRTRKVR